MEQEEYKKEEINWSYIEFVDNQDILDLIEKVCGWWYLSVYLCSLFSGPVSLLIKVLWDFLSDEAIPSYYLVFSQGDLFLLLLVFLPHSQYFIDCSFLVIFFVLFCVLQKPGGIIALLDEAWWVWTPNCWFWTLSFILQSKIYAYYFLCFRYTFSNFALFSSNIAEVRLLPCSMFPRSTHETFAQKLYQTFKTHKRFTKPKLARSDFTICHYAGDVSCCYFHW